MGCDIHLYVEKRVDGKWVAADKWGPDKYDESGGRKVVDYDDRFYTGRSYGLFSILANVRNGAGFKPIAMPRGLPKDVTPEVAAESESWDSDGHSHSWHTVADLLAYDWTQVTTCTGVIDAYQYARWAKFGGKDRNEFPDSFSGMVGGGGVKIISEADMIAHVEGRDVHDQDAFTDLAKYYCQIEWHPPYYRCAPDFWANAMPRLLHLGKPEDVRIIFFFDN